jgi:hypothetical protein
VARLGYRLATFKIPEPSAKARTKPSAYIPRPEGGGFTPTSVIPSFLVCWKITDQPLELAE